MTTTIATIALSIRQGFFDRLMGRLSDVFMESAMYRIAPTRKI